MKAPVMTLLVLFVGVRLLFAQERFEIEEIFPGVFVATPLADSMAGANAAFLVGTRDVLVVDTHMTPSSSRALIDQIRERTSLPVRFVVHTHWHPDHTQGSLSYSEAYPDAIVLSHRRTRDEILSFGAARLERDREGWPKRIAELERQLAELGESEKSVRAPSDERREIESRLEYERRFLEELNGLKLILPQVTFSESLTLHREGQRVQLLFFGRGHTGGDTVVHLPDARVSIVGDLVTGGPPFARDGFPSEWVETLARLEGLDTDWVVPGHGQTRRGGEVFRERRAFLEAALSRIRRGLADGESHQAIAASIDIDSYRDTFDPEPAHRPWRAWMAMVIDRFIEESR